MTDNMAFFASLSQKREHARTTRPEPLSELAATIAGAIEDREYDAQRFTREELVQTLANLRNATAHIELATTFIPDVAEFDNSTESMTLDFWRS